MISGSITCPSASITRIAFFLLFFIRLFTKEFLHGFVFFLRPYYVFLNITHPVPVARLIIASPVLSARLWYPIRGNMVGRDIQPPAGLAHDLAPSHLSFLAQQPI